MANNSVVTQEKLQEFYDTKIYDYLNGATHTGCVPLGTILPYFGETAPTHFLICDGTEYAKADYPELAEHLLALTNPTPYAGSDANHFKVPDLRGEFLRGTGTNGHSGQGSGGNVGVHQDGTEHIRHTIDDGGRTYFTIPSTENSSLVDSEHNIAQPTTNNRGTYVPDSTYKSAEGAYATFTSRPTNTSVTYIIAYRNAYIDLALDSFPIDISNLTDGQLLMYDATAGRWVNGGHKYSTDEHVVGTWIDGKPIYEKTIVDTSGSTAATFGTPQPKNIEIGAPIDTIVNSWGKLHYTSAWHDIPQVPVSGVDYQFVSFWIRDNTAALPNTIAISVGDTFKNCPIYVTIQYTKTTDTV